MTERMISGQFQEIFQLESEDERPSSYWEEAMVMLFTENLPLELEVYCKWFEYADRKWKDWFFHAPSRVFRKLSDRYFVLGQKGHEWIVYDVPEEKVKRLVSRKVVEEYDSFMSVFANES